MTEMERARHFMDQLELDIDWRRAPARSWETRCRWWSKRHRVRIFIRVKLVGAPVADVAICQRCGKHRVAGLARVVPRAD